MEDDLRVHFKYYWKLWHNCHLSILNALVECASPGMSSALTPTESWLEAGYTWLAQLSYMIPFLVSRHIRVLKSYR